MKHYSIIYFLLFALFASPQMLWAEDDAPSSIVMGYCDEVPYSGMSMGAGHEAIVAVRFDEAFASRFEGCRVSAIRVCMSGTIGATAGVWLSEERPEEIPTQTDPNDPSTSDYYKAAAGKPEEFAFHFPYEVWMDLSSPESLKWQWIEVPLPEPYVISRDQAFHAGFRSFPPIGGTSNAVVGVAGGGTEEHSWVYFHNAETPWCQLLETNMEEIGVNLMIQVRLEGENLPTDDIALVEVNGSGFLKAGEAYKYECVVQNTAVNTIKSFDVSYWLDGMEKMKNETMSFPNGIRYKQYGTFTIDDIVFTEPGLHHIEIEVSNPNGVFDRNDGNNTIMRSVNVYREEDVVPRRVLVENFTGLNCGNCPAAHKRVETALENKDAIVVNHHSGFYTDPFTTEADENYTWFYNSTSTYAPAIMMDRTNVTDFYVTGETGPIFLPRDVNELRNIYEILSEIPTYVGVDIDGNYNPLTRELSVTVSGNVLAFPEGSDHRINVWLTESGIPSYKVMQAQAGVEDGINYIHDNVMRTTLTGIWGEVINLKYGQYSCTYTTTIPEEWEAENMEIVAFLANRNERDCNDCKVFNAGKKSVKSLISNGISAVKENVVTTSYDISGLRVSKPNNHGVTINRAINPDGEVTVYKVIK